MSKKAKARWCEDGVTEVPSFTLSPEQACNLVDRLGLTRRKDVAGLKRDLEDVAAWYLRWKDKDEGGPTRAERNAALKEVVAASQSFEALLGRLDYASESELMDALGPYRSAIPDFDKEGLPTVEQNPRESGIRQFMALRDRLFHFNRSAARLLKRRLPQRGSEPRKTLPVIIDYLAEIYEQQTSDPVTHNPYEDVGAYTGVPQSRAGRFMVVFFEDVDHGLPVTAISTELARLIKRRNQPGKSVTQ